MNSKSHCIIQSPQLDRVAENRESSDQASENDNSTDCPLCNMAAEDTSKIYTHLQLGHKKSELAKLVVDREWLQFCS